MGQVSSIEAGIDINLQPYSFSFSGTARSIVFVGLPGFAACDSITFTPAQAAAVPEPVTLVLLGTGLAGVGAAVGMILAPAFIDVHTHIEGGIEARPTADNFLCRASACISRLSSKFRSAARRHRQVDDTSTTAWGLLTFFDRL